MLLSRMTGCTLSELRSGYRTYLNSYMSSIDNNIQHICPNCQVTPHDITPHIQLHMETHPVPPNPNQSLGQATGGCKQSLGGPKQSQEAASFLGLHEKKSSVVYGYNNKNQCFIPKFPTQIKFRLQDKIQFKKLFPTYYKA